MDNGWKQNALYYTTHFAKGIEIFGMNWSKEMSTCDSHIQNQKDTDLRRTNRRDVHCSIDVK